MAPRTKGASHADDARHRCGRSARRGLTPPARELCQPPLGRRFPLGNLRRQRVRLVRAGRARRTLRASARRPLWLQAGATVGFLGAYTTFSTLSLQVYRSTVTGHATVVAANAVGTLLAGVLAVYAGILLARAL